MSTLRITFTADDHEKLDKALATVLRALPTIHHTTAEVTVTPRVTGKQTRQLLLSDPDENTIGNLARIDIPHAVAISISEV